MPTTSLHRTALLLGVFLLLPAAVCAQVPRVLSYQGILTDSTGAPKPDGNYSFTFRLYPASSGGSALWTETKSLAVHDGLFSTSLGDATALNLPFTAPYWLSVQVTPGAELSPRTRLTSAGYSLHSQKADTALFAASGAGFSLPYAGTGSTGGILFSVTSTGAGNPAGFIVNNASHAGSAVAGISNGTGEAVAGSGTGAADGVVGKTTGTGHAVVGEVSGAGTGRAGSFRNLNANSPARAVHVETNGTGPALYVLNTGSSTSAPAIYVSKSVAGDAIASYSVGGDAVAGYTSGAGNGINGTTSGSGYAVYGSAAGAGAGVGGYTTGSGRAGRFEVNNASNSTSGLFAVHNGTGNALAAVHTGTGRAGYFEISNAASPQAALYATTNGTGLAALFNGDIQADVLRIVGGSDMAEPFEVDDADAAEPGTVMVIDPGRPGALAVSGAPYDARVAGIVSGAGGVAPGVTLRQDGVLDGSALVAIAGRVYCKAEALSAAIEPGDLLTTSAVPGHAMKASDHGRSHGAIIGKAMTPLRGGKGLVLVLVNLQ